MLVETGGKDATNVPKMLSVACGEGDLPADQLTPVLNGGPAAQVDVLCTWPERQVEHACGGDGSLDIGFRETVAIGSSSGVSTPAISSFGVPLFLDSGARISQNAEKPRKYGL